MTDAVRICRVDYASLSHAAALVAMLDSYARDPMGGGEGLSDFAKAHVVTGLAKTPQAFSILAFDGDSDEKPVGLANCFMGFSTFACRPLVNVHDLVVSAAYRGRGIGSHMLAFMEDLARARDACKLTLEVLSGNAPAMRLYHLCGFVPYVLDPAAGQAHLMQKRLD